MRLGDLDAVFETGRNLLRERDDKVSVQRRGYSGERVETVLRTAPFFHSRDDGLRCSHPFGQRALAEARRGTQVVDELAECEILIHAGADLRARLTPAL